MTRSSFRETALSHPADHPMQDDTQINWLELARFAAAGQGHSDLGRGVQRLATLAAAVHRGAITQTLLIPGTEKDTQWVQGRTPQVRNTAVTEDKR